MVGKDDAIYSGSSDFTIRMWSGETGTHLRTLAEHMAPVLSLAVGPDGKVYSGSTNKTVRAWSQDVRALMQTLKGHRGGAAVAAGRHGTVHHRIAPSEYGVGMAFLFA